MAKVEANVVINRPLAEVFQYMSVNENALQWQSGLRETRITNDVTGPGRAWIDTIQFLGRRMETPFQLTTDRQLDHFEVATQSQALDPLERQKRPQLAQAKPCANTLNKRLPANINGRCSRCCSKWRKRGGVAASRAQFEIPAE